MLGLIAAIIAFVKRRNTFGAAMLIWWIVGLLFLFLGAFPFILLPGPLFVIIAIKMRSDRVPKIKSADEARITQCPKCGYDLVLNYAICPNCGSSIKRETSALSEAKSEKNETDKVDLEEQPETKTDVVEPTIDVLESEDRSEQALLNKQREDVEQSDPAPLTTTVRFCRKCGRSLAPNSKFCRFCGTKIIVEEGE